MSRRQSTTPGRIARAIVAATVLGAALTGCAVAIDGTPQAQGHPVALSTPRTSPPATPAPRSDESRTPPSTAGTPPPRSGEPLAPHAAVLARWVVRGWTPLPLLRATDPGSGVSAAMFGPAKTQTTDGGAPYFATRGAPAGILTTFGVLSTPGNRVDGEEAARRSAANVGGQLVSSERSVVDGRTVHDSVIEVRSPEGTEMRQLIRSVELPDRVVLLQTIGARSEARTMDEAHDILTGTLRIP
jgi:hypothetical protein